MLGTRLLLLNKLTFIVAWKFARVAQWLMHLSCKEEIVSSILTSSFFFHSHLLLLSGANSFLHATQEDMSGLQDTHQKALLPKLLYCFCQPQTTIVKKTTAV